MAVRTRLKVCCIKSVGEARMAVAAGADILGLVGPMPSGPGTITYAQARSIAAELPDTVEPWLLTSETTATTLAAAAEESGVSNLQIVRHLDPDELERLRSSRPELKLVQVIHVEDEGALGLISRYERHIDAFLLDSGKPSAAIETLGGTGDVHDWSISARFVAATNKPVMLAGGLKAGNVLDAVRRVRPYGVDLCSSLRQEDALDAELLQEFVQALRLADQERT
ncbi:phosphoribosylanthranilate isomerase [Maricaulis sp.]|uniref:phosphoribosylanthranilate isomerase n=1 Tax=Maricaulis sp. TaxID=1486257 RepID=UPI001B0A784B|nr:phosphoribosylanthranilate isomerase [Maricaulis sp.]MBO6795783.1 phosphoribosylanthranilate isomerase [Maricaulis sp.]